MHFNVKKCAVLSITRKCNPKLHEYTLLGETLNRVKNHDYIGVTISHDLSWNDQFTNSWFATQNVKSKHKPVRPQLDYASEVWIPSTTSQINRLEQIQRSAVRFVYADYCRYTLASQRTKLGFSPYTQTNPTGYNVLQDLPRPCPYITTCLQRAHYISSRKDHPLKYTKINLTNPSVNVYKFAFYPRAVAIWNHLPGEAVLYTTPSIKHFQSYGIPFIKELTPVRGCHIL